MAADTSGKRYVRVSQGRVRQFLHRLMLPDAVEVDHIDGDGTNNCRYNLRAVTHQQNHFNRVSNVGRSKYKGVCWKRQTGRWQAYIRYNGVLMHLGYHVDEVDAARAYNSKAAELFGEYARLNDI